MAELERLFKYLAIAARSLLQQRLRSFLSMAGIIAGVMLVLILQVLGEGARRELLQGVEQLGARNIMIRAEKVAGATGNALSAADMMRLSALLGSTTRIAGFREVGVTINGVPGHINAQTGACTSGYPDIAGIRLINGRFISDEDIRRRSSICVIGERLANLLGERGKIGQTVQLAAEPFVIVGIMTRRIDDAVKLQGPVTFRDYNSMILVPLGSEQVLIPGGMTTALYLRPPVSEIIIQVPDINDVPVTAELVRSSMSRLHDGSSGFQIVAPLELLKQAEASGRTMRLFLGCIAALALIIGSIGITNVMLASIAERTREIGIRRSLGATRQDIMQQFITESLILTTVGGLCGILLGLIAVATLMPLTGWPIAVSGTAIVMPFIISMASGVMAGAYPAYTASRLDPMEALRFT